jgi:hypothetical protein
MFEAGHGGLSQISNKYQAESLFSAGPRQQMVSDRPEQCKKLCIPRAIDRRRTENRKIDPASTAQFEFASQLALAIFRNRVGRVIFPGRLRCRGRAGNSEAGDVNDSFYVSSVQVYGFDNIPRSELVGLAKFCHLPHSSAAGTMDDVRDANHRRAQTFGLGNGTLAHLHLRQMMLEESLVARWPKQDNARNVPGAERV